MSTDEVLDALLRAERAGDETTADAALDRMLALAAKASGPDAAARAQVDRALGAALGLELSTPEGGGAAGELAGEARSVWARSVWARLGSKLGLVTIGVAIGFAWGRAPQWSARVSSAEREPRDDGGALQATAPGASIPASPSGAVESAASDVATPVRSASSAVSAVAPASRPAVPARAVSPSGVPARAVPTRATRDARADVGEPSPDTLRIALEQLRKAQLFLSASEPGRALAALDELDARVPAAVLADEREVTRVLALCKTGDAATAATLAARVLDRSPDSAYAVSLRESCAGPGLLVEQMRERTSNRAR